MSSDLPSSQQTNNNQQKSTSSNEPKKRVCFICGSYTDLTINIYEPRAGPNIVDVINEKFNVQPLNDDKYLCYSCNNWLINWHSLQNKNETSSGSKKYVNKISKNKFNSNRTIPEEELESIVTISAEMTNTKDDDAEVAAKKILNIDNLCSVSKEADELRKNLKKYFYYPKKLLATNTNHHHHHHHMVLPSASEQQFAAITTIPLISHRKKILDVFRKKQQQKQLQKQRRQLRYKLMKKYIKCNLCGKLMRQNQSISQQYQLHRKYHQYLKNITTKLCQKCKQYLRKLYVMIKEQQEQDEQQQQQQHLNGNSNRTSIYSDYYQQQSDNISDLVNPNLIIKLQKLGTTVRYENSPLPQSTSTTTTTTTITTTSTSTINSTSTTINEHNKFSTIFNYNNDIDNYDDNNDYYEEIFRDIDNEEYIQQQQQQQQYQQHQQDQSRNKNDILITFNKVITEALPLDLLKFIRNL